MEGDGVRDSASRSSLESSKNTTQLVRSNELSGTDIGSTLGARMSSVSLGSGAGYVSEHDETGGSTRSGVVEKGLPMVRPECLIKTGSFVVTEDVQSRSCEDISMISTPETSLKSGAGGSFFSEAPVGPVLSPEYEEKADRDVDDRFTPVELRATDTAGRGEIVGDLSGEGGFVYSTDSAFKNRSLSWALGSPVPATDQEEKTLSSIDEATPDDLRLTSTPVCGRIVGDMGSGGGLLYSKDLEEETSRAADPCSPIPTHDAH